ncbi:hypothetical protein [Blastococcus sp. SYSU DS0541]
MAAKAAMKAAIDRQASENARARNSRSGSTGTVPAGARAARTTTSTAPTTAEANDPITTASSQPRSGASTRA